MGLKTTPSPVTIVTIQSMKPPYSALKYPLIIKQHLDFVVLSVPDLGITVVENLPPDHKLTPKYLNQLALSLAKTWLKAQKKLLSHYSVGLNPPKPSKHSSTTKKGTERLMTSTEVAVRLGITRMSVNRLVKRKLLQCTKTNGGHQRFTELQLKQYEKLLKKTDYLT